MGPRDRLANLGESERTVDGHKPVIPRGLALPEEEAMELWLRVAKSSRTCTSLYRMVSYAYIYVFYSRWPYMYRFEAVYFA